MLPHTELSILTALPLITQVRVICGFPETKYHPLPSSLSVLLLYVEFFEVFGLPDNVTRMYRLQCKFYPGPDSHPCHCSAVIPITAVIYTVELIPIYGVQHNRQATTNISLEVYEQFFLNNYIDKEWYCTVSKEYL